MASSGRRPRSWSGAMNSASCAARSPKPLGVEHVGVELALGAQPGRGQVRRAQVADAGRRRVAAMAQVELGVEPVRGVQPQLDRARGNLATELPQRRFVRRGRHAHFELRPPVGNRIVAQPGCRLVVDTRRCAPGSDAAHLVSWCLGNADENASLRAVGSRVAATQGIDGVGDQPPAPQVEKGKGTPRTASDDGHPAAARCPARRRFFATRYLSAGERARPASAGSRTIHGGGGRAGHGTEDFALSRRHPHC